jgi:RNA polymerase sigma-70 factor (ECF subfamily)
VDLGRVDRGAAGDEQALIDGLRAGDEQAFASLLDRYYAPMLRVARDYVATREAAEDVVQETFLGVLRGIDRFEGRSSLKTWLFRILVNRARTRGEREARTVPFSALETGEGEPAVDPSRFVGPGHRWSGFWASPPSRANPPEERVLAAEAVGVLQPVIDDLPPNQRLVITLRDVEGFSAPEVCDLLGISDANQRVLLHRARSKARAAYERYLDEREAVAR